MKTKLIFAICVCLIPVSVFAADSYLCITDKSTGFHYDKDLKEWKSANFKAGDKYILKKVKKGDLTYVPPFEEVKVGDLLVYNFGSSDEIGHCPDKLVGIYRCDMSLLWPGLFNFNANTMRFLMVHTKGYWDYNPKRKFPDGGNEPNIEIGKCSPL